MRSRVWILVAVVGCGGGELRAGDGTVSGATTSDPHGSTSTPLPDDPDDRDPQPAGDTGDPVDSGLVDTGTGTSGAAACTLGAPSTRHFTLQLPFEGQTRSAIVDLPDDYDGSEVRPLVLNFHGLATTAQQQKTYTGMAGAANARGWIAVHPDGTNRSWDWLPESQDVRFVDALLDELSAQLCVDERRVYLTGLSNGGYFSYQFACDRGDRITAIAPVAGAQTSPVCNPGVKVPLLHIHGTDDDTVPYDGNLISPGARESVTRWAERVNDCHTDPEETAVIGDVRCETWSCSPIDSASLCTVEGGGHTWPGTVPLPLLGETNQDIDATEEILDFFARWARP